MMRRLHAFALRFGWAASFALGACQPAIQPAMSCDSADNLNQVSGGKLCLAIATFMPEEQVSRPILRIYLHGDVSRGGPADYLYSYAAASPPGIVSVVMLRPGYYDQEGKRSSGSSHGRRDSYTAENVDAIATAVRELAAHYEASRVILVGHSGGAAISAVILGRHPGIADAALLASCPCDLVTWRRSRGKRLWSRSLDPIDYVDSIPPDTGIIAVTGARDGNTEAKLCRPYIARLKARGVSARLEIIEGAGHGFRRIGRSGVYKAALADLDDG